jgi:DNA-directed RNA polymerase subunit omega
MARITVEDCLEHVENRFALVHLASCRVRQLDRGSRRLFDSKNKDVVHALREIAEGLIKVNRVADEPVQDVAVKTPSAVA